MKPFSGRMAAFSLIEVTLALGVAGFCLIAVFGLLPIGVQTNQRALSQTAATAILSSVVADMRATPKPYDNSKIYYVGDSVLSSGNCYTAIAATTGNSPPNATYWSTGSACPQFGITFGAPTTLYFDGTGQFSTLRGPNSRYRLSVTFPANAGFEYSPTYADLKVTWPASVDPLKTTPGGSSEIFAAFDRHP